MSNLHEPHRPLESHAPHAHEDHVELPAAPVVSRTRITSGLMIGAVVLGGLFVAGWLPHRLRAAQALAASEEHASGPRRAEVIKPRVASTLPGSVSDAGPVSARGVATSARRGPPCRARLAASACAARARCGSQPATKSAVSASAPRIAPPTRRVRLT